MAKEHGQSKDDVLMSAARGPNGSWVCWACGQDVAKPVVKRRRERRGSGYYAKRSGDYGVYHQRCKARWDREAEQAEALAAEARRLRVIEGGQDREAAA